MKEKEIHYTSTNSYSTLNTKTSKTRNIWFVCHGMGYLSRYFLKYFKSLNPEENYIIAPQAPSKYYQQPKMHVGANWLTRDNTAMGMTNITRYFDAIFMSENLENANNLIVFGYSQGVSVATRYVAQRQIQCRKLVLHSGGIPKELEPHNFNHLSPDTEVTLIYGTADEYLNNERIQFEQKHAESLFGKRLETMPFDGPHVVHVDYIKTLV